MSSHAHSLPDHALLASEYLMDETDLPEAWELAKGILATSEHPEIRSKAHELLARCSELEDNPGGALLHYEAAEQTAAEGHYYVQATRMACAQAMRHAELENPHEATDAFLNALEYWELLDLDHEHPGLMEVRKKLDKACKTVLTRKFEYPDKWSRVADYMTLRNLRHAIFERRDEAREQLRAIVTPDPSWPDLERLYEYHGLYGEKEDPEEVAKLIESVLDSPLDRVHEGYAWSTKFWVLGATGAEPLEQIEALKAAEAIWSETEVSRMALESTIEQAKLYAEIGWRSEAIDAFVRAVDYWRNLERRRPWPKDEDYWDGSKADLEEAFKAVSNRGLRERTRDEHVEHCRETGRDPAPPLPEAWQVEPAEA